MTTMMMTKEKQLSVILNTWFMLNGTGNIMLRTIDKEVV